MFLHHLTLNLDIQTTLTVTFHEKKVILINIQSFIVIDYHASFKRVTQFDLLTYYLG